MSHIICSECRKEVKEPLLKHYRNQHPSIYEWATRMKVTKRQTRRLFGK